MQLNILPQNVCNKVDKLVRSFVSVGDGNTRTWNRVKWETITSPRKFGGLAIRRKHLTNISLVGKLVWSLQHDEHKLWVQILTHKYLHG